MFSSQNNKEAIDNYSLGCRYKTGQGIEKDEILAAKHFKLAANQKHKESQHRLEAIAATYETGLGVEIDEELILEYYKLTAEQGSIEAALRLSIIYKIGWGGIKQNIELANHFHRLATMVGDQDAFRQFIKSTKKSNKLLEAPSLLVRIFEKSHTGVLEQGLYKYIFSPGVELSKSYIPWDPPHADLQRGPTCGLNALKKGLDWSCQSNTPPVRKNPIKPTKLEKEKNQNIISLRKAAKEFGSVTGEIYDIDLLEKIAKKFEFTCNTIKLKGEDRRNYIKKILDAIQARNSVILPVDNDNGFPGDKQGKETHYALAWGYIYKDKQYHFLVTHWGQHYLWSADELQKSHEQLPDINPRYDKYYKDHKKDGYYSCKENLEYPEEDIRFMPPSNLENFKFTALVIPATKENFLNLDKAKVAAIQYVNTTVKSTDAITLKLLAEMGGIFRPPLKMEDDTENENVPLEIKSCAKESIAKLC